MCQWFESKLQEVENEEQLLRRLHAAVDSLVNHRKGENENYTVKPVFQIHTVTKHLKVFLLW